MSSIRLFVLGSLAERGAMHGHALKLLAEEEHIDLWADVAASAIHGVIKRLAAEALIVEIRTEREGNYPERSVYEITDAGRESLASLRQESLEQIVIRPDPFDLGLARLDPDRLDELEDVIRNRYERLVARAAAEEIHLTTIAHYLTLLERHVMSHTLGRLRGEIAWHEELLTELPTLISDEKSRKGHFS